MFASSGEVHLETQNSARDVNVDSFETLGSVSLTDSLGITISGNGGGTLIIRSGQLFLDDTEITTSITATPNSTVPADVGIGVDIKTREAVVLNNNSALESNVIGNAPPDVGSGGVHIESTQVEIANNSFLSSSVFPGSTGGKSGGVVVNADNVILRENGEIFSNNGGNGSGDIYILANNVEVKDGSGIATLTFNGTGHAGNITIDTKNLMLSNPNPLGSSTSITSQTFSDATGNAGNVDISAENITITGGGPTEISSATFAVGGWWRAKPDH